MVVPASFHGFGFNCTEGSSQKAAATGNSKNQLNSCSSCPSRKIPLMLHVQLCSCVVPCPQCCLDQFRVPALAEVFKSLVVFHCIMSFIFELNDILLRLLQRCFLCRSFTRSSNLESGVPLMKSITGVKAPKAFWSRHHGLM